MPFYDHLQIQSPKTGRAHSPQNSGSPVLEDEGKGTLFLQVYGGSVCGVSIIRSEEPRDYLFGNKFSS